MALFCPFCKEQKPTSAFNKSVNAKSGHQTYCRVCAVYRRKNPDVLKRRSLRTGESFPCPSCNLLKSKEDFHKTKGSKSGYAVYCKHCLKHRNQANAAYARKYNRRYRELNADSLKEKIKAKNQTPQVKERVRNYCRKRYHDDLQFRLRLTLRNRLRFALGNKTTKAGSAVNDLGCPIADLKLHLEGQFYPHLIHGHMTWDNYGIGLGKWQIDHVQELRSFDLEDRKQFIAACHFTNLQPLWHDDHIAKTVEFNGKSRVDGHLAEE